MRRRRYRLRPPTSSGYKAGQVLTFDASDNAPHPSELVRLTPVGPAPLELEFKPEHDKIRSASIVGPASNTSAAVELGAGGIHSILAMEKQCIMEYLRSGPKAFTQIQRYLYNLAGFDTRAKATDEMLTGLVGEGLVGKCEGQAGLFHLKTRDKNAAHSPSTH